MVAYLQHGGGLWDPVSDGDGAGDCKNRWHVPVQVVGTVIAVMGWYVSHFVTSEAFVRASSNSQNRTDGGE